MRAAHRFRVIHDQGITFLNDRMGGTYALPGEPAEVRAAILQAFNKVERRKGRTTRKSDGRRSR